MSQGEIMAVHSSGDPENFRNEIRGVVNALLGLTDLLLDTPLDSVQREYVGVLRSTADRLFRLGGEDVPEEFSAPQPLPADSIDIDELLAQVVEIGSALGAERGVTVTKELKPAENTCVLGNREFLERALVAVVKACISAPVEGLHIEADSSGLPDLHARVHARVARTSFSELRGHVVSAERYAGPLLAEERADGMLVSFSVPVQSAPRELAHSVKRRVLLAEDAADNQFIVRAFLRNEPFDLDVVGSGGEALERVRTERYDIVLMDLHMPGMGGMEAVTAIRAWECASDRPPVAIVALTARCDADDVASCLARGFSGFLAKPVSKAALLHALRAHSANILQ